MIKEFLKLCEENKEKISKKIYIEKIKKITNNPLLVISLIPYIFSNLRDIEDFSKYTMEAFTDNEKEIELAIMIATYIYYTNNNISKEYIEMYLKNKFKYSFDIENLEKNIIEVLNNEEKEEYLFKLRNKEKEEINNILKYKEFFAKKEIVNWLPTNNRKTEVFYADYGVETNELIKFIKSSSIMDYDYKRNIELLKINSFEKYLDETPNIIGIKAILSSLVFRERYGVGTLSRSIKDGLIIKILNFLEKYIK